MSPETQPEKVVYMPIGVVASSFNEPGDPKAMRNAESTLILDKKYVALWTARTGSGLSWSSITSTAHPATASGYRSDS
jgi:hypothetical protein